MLFSPPIDTYRKVVFRIQISRVAPYDYLFKYLMRPVRLILFAHSFQLPSNPGKSSLSPFPTDYCITVLWYEYNTV